MELLFPKLSGGQAQGLNDAGVETFQGSIDVHLARECGQNTGDAKRRDVRAARLVFSRSELKPSQIPDFASLHATLAACLDFWEGKDKERQFFEDALALAGRATIPVLRISDTGTTGLTGGDTDTGGRWYALVKSQGLSNKDDTAGGSFGIGKSSPFAASRFRTVFYGTRLGDGAVGLQGVCRLVTHRNREGRQTQGTGFIGTYDPDGEDGDPVFRAVRDPGVLPSAFSRSDQGTDIWVIGYRSGDDWAEEVTKSVLTNFWPALHRGQLVFRVGEQEITRENCGELIERYAGQADFDAHHYYKAILTRPSTRSLKHTGSCELYLTTNSMDLPKRVCMVRSNGMRIYDYAPRACRVPFAGLFICTDVEGNKLLRQMEPPRHDKWDEKRVEGTAGKRALTEIKEWIREEVKGLNPFFTGKSFNESELAKYLPDEMEDESPETQDKAGDSEDESLEPKPGRGEVKSRTAPPRPSALVPGDELEPAGGAGGTGTEPRGEGTRAGGGATGTGGGSEEKKAARVRLQVRAYAPAGDGAYTVIIRSAVDFSGAVALTAIGEDGEREPLLIQKASLAADTASELACEGNKIRGISLSAGVPLRLVVAIDALAPRSLTGVAAA
jgi:hypothetical protein